MRPAYPEAQVIEMAESIRARGGVEQALIVVPGPRGKFYVVDGNLRLEGTRRLGPNAPLLKCEVRTQATAEQLLTMTITNRFRYRVDPISEARHYRRLMREEHYSADALAKAVGVPRHVVDDLLLLLKLPESVQRLMAEEKFSKDARVARALLKLPPAAAAKLAEHMVGSPVRAILHSVEKLQETLAAAARPVRRASGSAAPAVCLARARKSPPGINDPVNLTHAAQLPPASQLMPWTLVRTEVRKTCRACDIMAETLPETSEPAWALIAHAAGSVCSDCALAEVEAACNSCPQVDLLRRLVREVRKETAHAAPV